MMISSIRGKLKVKSPTYIVVEVNGVGYGIQVPLSTYDKLEEVGSEVEIETYLYVREDNLQLYGFGTLEEKDLFELLISVNGVGPKIALGALSGLSAKEIKEAIAEEKLTLLTTLSGIGKKTAQRIILELREKIGLPPGEELRRKPGEIELFKDAVNALISLGCRPAEARKAVRKAEEELPGDTPLENLIKYALKLL
jgi:Holliday junction DNA helicase RuvA